MSIFRGVMNSDGGRIIRRRYWIATARPLWKDKINGYATLSKIAFLNFGNLKCNIVIGWKVCILVIFLTYSLLFSGAVYKFLRQCKACIAHQCCILTDGLVKSESVEELDTSQVTLGIQTLKYQTQIPFYRYVPYVPAT